jgi:23S rRNA (uracil1939-C5)-methyltransferase
VRPKTNERAEIEIEKLVAGGSGLARVSGSGEVVLVARAAPGDRLAVEIERRGRPARGRLLKVLTPSVDRVEPACAWWARCGGCDWMHLSPEAQRRERIARVVEAMPSEARGVEVRWHAATPARGRTRARWHLVHAQGRSWVGYRAAGASTVIEPTTCIAIDPRLEAALPIARAILAEATTEGELHAALGAEGKPVLAIVTTANLPGATFAAAERFVSDGALAGVRIQLGDARTPATIGDPTPRATIDDGPALESPSGGFAQASEQGDRVLTSLVRARADASGKKVLELFSGSGNFTVGLAADAAQLIAVEAVESAVVCARKNLAARGLASKAKLVVADAESFAIGREHAVVVLDPPRAGARKASEAIAASRASRVVYVACDPATLGRDLATLLRAGFALESLDAVDMFPETSHVETVATLVRAR